MKLDQLGYEFFPCGSCTVITGRKASLDRIRTIEKIILHLEEYRRPFNTTVDLGIYECLLILVFPQSKLSSSRLHNISAATDRFINILSTELDVH